MLTPTPTVFVVDDDASVRKALSRLLMSAGLRVETFADAGEFLARAPQKEHGCILLDVRMPKVTGFDVQAQLAQAGIDLPIIFVSAYADVAQAVRAMKAGALDVFSKPFRDDALLDAVNRALAWDRARTEDRTHYEELRHRYSTLTAREREVMSLVVTGMPNKQVAGILGTSEKTVKVHRAHVVTKMQASSLPDLVRMADRLGVHEAINNSEPERVPKVQWRSPK